MFRAIDFGVEQIRTADVARHIHFDGYANVVLAGQFTEAAFAGCFRAEPGSVLLHGPFDCHVNFSASDRRLVILRLPWRGPFEGAYRVGDPDGLARLAERDPIEAEHALRDMIEPANPSNPCWVDELAAALKHPDGCDLQTWSERHDLAPSSVSRGFRKIFQVSPRRFRLDVRTRQAWTRIVRETAPFTRIAHDCGFADLAHMSRSVAAMTGASPKAWRSMNRACWRPGAPPEAFDA